MMKKQTKKQLKKIAVWYLGPITALMVVVFLAFAAAAAGITGYVAYQTIQTIRAEHELISNSLSGNCKAALEKQGFTVEKTEPAEEKTEPAEEGPMEK